MHTVSLKSVDDNSPQSQRSATPPFFRRVPIAMRTWLKSSFVRRCMMAYRHVGLSESDVLLASYPKSGNTWLRHLLAYVSTGEPTLWRGSLGKVSDVVGRHASLPCIAKNSGRLIKTHEAYRTEYKRAVLLVRDPRDVVVSEYYFRRTYSADFYRYNDDFVIFAKAFMAGKTGGYGNWATHVASWLDAADASRCDVLIVPFEQFKANTVGEARRIVDFIGLAADDTLLEAAVKDCGVESMKKKEEEYWAAQGKENLGFIRGGKTGSWQQHFDSELESSFWEVMGPVAVRAGYERLQREQAG